MAHIPPATKDEFSFSIDSFFVEASGHNHRRATASELEAIFHPKKSAETVKDPVGHWYEAQLRHYGLPPSKNKAVAKTRLLDAVNSGKLAVPQDIKAVETQLAKEWAKRHREARAALKKAESGASKETTASKEPKAALKKRKAETNDEPADHTAAKKVAKAAPKKEKATPAAKSPKPPATAAPKNATTAKNVTPAKAAATKPKPVKSTAPKPPPTTTSTPAKAPSSKSTQPAIEKSEEKKPRTKQTARCTGRGGATLSGRGNPQTARRGGASAGPSRSGTAGNPFLEDNHAYFKHSDSDEDDGYSRPGPVSPDTARRLGIQTARRGRPQTARRGGASIGAFGHMFNSGPQDDDDEVKEEKIDGDSDAMEFEYNNDSNPPSPAFGSLGLLNGTYDITCDDLREWSMYDDHEFTLIMALQGTEIWMSYDFGMFSGIIHLSRRPFEASDNRIEFTWRGVENSEGVITYNGQGGWIQFLGNGRIEGMIPVYGEAKFRGTRISGNATRSERSAISMRQEWDGYSEAEYERRRVGRWG